MNDTSRLIKNMKPFLQEIWEKNGFTSATEIQEKAIPFVLEGKDVIAESPTGTGKTLAYMLPILNTVDPDKKGIQAAILAPTRELVMQIQQVAQKWTEGSGIEVASFIGGADIKRQLEKLKKHPQVIVGTANRIYELIQMKKLKMHEVKTIVLDEGDQLIVPQAEETIRNIIKTTLNERQLLMFSATLSPRTEKAAREWMKEPESVRIQGKVKVPTKTDHIYFLCELREKADILRRLAKMGAFKGMVFLNDTKFISQVASRLENKNVAYGILSGESTKTEREAALNNFRSGKYPLLLVTDVAARGLDIEGLTHVIHYDFPQDITQYVHRSGRTGRMGASGTVVSLVTEREERLLKQFSGKLGFSLTKKYISMGQVVDEKPQRSGGERKKGTFRQGPGKKKG